jgi:2-dehydro-3-deoxygluconokinase
VTYSAVAIGECMLELSAAGNRAWRMGAAGDTYNTSVYLSRLGMRTAYLTALGTDPFSARCGRPGRPKDWTRPSC